VLQVLDTFRMRVSIEGGVAVAGTGRHRCCRIESVRAGSGEPPAKKFEDLIAAFAPRLCFSGRHHVFHNFSSENNANMQSVTCSALCNVRDAYCKGVALA
jgi:hypothetical protein